MRVEEVSARAVGHPTLRSASEHLPLLGAILQIHCHIYRDHCDRSMPLCSETPHSHAHIHCDPCLLGTGSISLLASCYQLPTNNYQWARPASPGQSAGKERRKN